MKVFNKEVEECCMCPCLDHLDMDGSPYCNMLQKDIKDCDTIDKDCPFNKSVTKEDFEKFGFNYFPKYILSHKGAFVLERNDLYPKIGNTDITVDYLVEWYDNRFAIFILQHNENEIYENQVLGAPRQFIGTINNPIELEFILQSIGIIESK